nr:reverse transcriptase domain-containing protein [Tanacetum cinerariifolium]
MATLTEMMSKLVSANTASSSGSQNTAPVQPSVIQSESQASVSEPIVAPVSSLMPNLKTFIPYPSRRDNEKRRDQANEQIEKFYEIFKEMSFEISFTDALILMPKFTSTLKALIENKEKLSEMARTMMNEHCSAVILNKLPRKLGDPGKFLIPCEFSEIDECLALADLSASINLMPLSVWEGLSLPELTPTCMTLKLADRSVSKPLGIAKDVSFKVGVFHFPADFVVVDFEPDPRVPLILGRCFLKTSRALIDVHKGELTLCIGNKAITYNLDQTMRYSANYNQMTNTAPVQPLVIQSESQASVSEPIVAPVSALMPNLKTSIPYPSRRDNEKRHDQANEQIEKFYEIFKEMSFEISFTDALILMPKFTSTLRALIGNKEKLSEMARTMMNEHCSAVILNKLPRKLGDPGKFLIPCEFSEIDECLALADLGASINLMPLSVWEGLSLPELTPTCMTLELADRSVSKPIGIAKDVSFKVGVFHFPADFVVVDFEPDPRVPLILGRSFLKTSRALIDVHKGELTLCIGNKAITYNLDQTVRYSANYNQMMVNKIDVVESACEEYSQEVLGFSNVTDSGTPTPQNDPIVFVTSPTLTPFGDSDFLLFEEADAFLGLEDDPDSSKINPFYYDPEGDILLLEAILNSEPSPPPPNQEQNLPSFKEELKAYEA